VRTRALLLAVLVVAALGTGCDYTGGTGPRVALTGDSILHNGEARVRAKLVPNYRVTMLAVPAGRITDLQGIVRLQVRSNPQVMVLQVGSPDVEFAAESPYGFAISLEMRKMMDATRGVPCVIWVNLKEGGVSPYYTPRWQQTAAALNDFVAQLDANRPWVRVVDWAALAAANPGWFQSDGLHLTELGRAALASTIDTAVASC
jgi:lysophospholipase L1-like esterase